MSDLLPFLVIGLAIGSLYGLAGMGLVLTYRTSGVFNFGHAALGAGAAYFFYTLHFTWGWPWPLAMLVAVAVFGALAGVVIERLTRGLAGARTATIMVATIGILLFVQGFLYWGYGVERRLFPHFLPTGTVMSFSGVTVNWAQVINFGIGVASFVALYLFLHRTRLGVAMRGVVAAPDLMALTGTNPVRVRVAAWVIGSSFAALTGILITPAILGMDAFLLSALVVQAFGAVAIGRFTSLPLTYLGGLIVGGGAAVATKYFTEPPLTGLPNVLPFIVLVVVMLVTAQHKLPAAAGRQGGAFAARRALPRKVVVGRVVAGCAVLVAIPAVVGSRLPVYTAGLSFVVLFLSLSLLTRVSGQISLAHAAFAGVGAAIFSHLAAPNAGAGGGGFGEIQGGAPWLVALMGAGLVTSLVGAALALPAMRLSGVYLALATLGFSLLMDQVGFLTKPLYGQTSSSLAGLRAPRPEFGPIHADNLTHWYYVVLAVVAVSCVILLGLQRSRLGRFLRAMADSPTALTTMGLGTNVTRVIVFAVSAGFAGVAGALWAMGVGRVNYISFPAINSLLYLAILTVAGAFAGFLLSAFLAAFLFAVLPSHLSSITFEVQSLLFGAAAVGAALVIDRNIDWAAQWGRLKARVERSAVASEERRERSPVGARALDTPTPGTLGGEALGVEL